MERVLVQVYDRQIRLEKKNYGIITHNKKDAWRA
jgi:hypothetical protein